MKWQSTAILAAVLAGLGAYIYFVERPKPESAGDDRTTYAWNLSDMQAQPIDRIEVKAGTDSVVFVKVPPKPTPKPTGSATDSPTPDPLATPPQPTWHKEDKPDLGLTYQWDSAWSDFKRMMVDRVVDEKPKDDTMYEFASPSVEVKIHAGKKVLHSFVVGKKAISGSGFYLKTGEEPKVYLVSSYKVDTWKKLAAEPPVATPTPPPPTPEPTPVPTPSPTPAAVSKAATGSQAATGSTEP
ncbi:MAG: DUF4340 domain-containing protein [Candidatus Sericytochromatia bacterium]|nr:DUF4340 domain-containing protein [Candidatus Tanganyikabacteria bacterium]